DLPNPGIKPSSPVSPVLAGGFFTTSATWEAQRKYFLDDIYYYIFTSKIFRKNNIFVLLL
ncbi:hypothetical protein U8M34_29115, partial [Klebsiella pneumoniae]|uniref:hypothetical protein n=1 Tax=Klebsiella pneumoniae TaxID=573 RepID=UPI002ADF6EE4